MNRLSIVLTGSDSIVLMRGARDYDSILDDVTSILSDIAEALADTGQVRFEVSGFGDDLWPVDVLTDLAVAIEQVPAVIDALSRGESATLGFYEQGIERILTMTPHGSEVTIACVSMTDWQPSPESLDMKTDELIEIMQRLLDDFVDLARRRCPDIVNHPWFQAWCAKAS